MKKKVLLLIISFTFPQLIIFLFQLYFRKVLPVEFFGIWTFFLVIIKYLSYFYTPIRTTIDWKGPILFGRSHVDEKRELIGTTLNTMVLTSLILIIIASIYISFLNIQGKTYYFVAFCSVLISQRGFKGYFEMIFRNERYYNFISIVRLILDIGTPVLQFVLIIFYGWKGFLYGLVIIGLAYMVIYSINFLRKINFKLAINKKNLNDIYKSGVIILVSSLITNLFFTMDQVFIKSFLGIEQLGIYSFSVLFMDKALLIGSPLLMIFQPDFYEWHKRIKSTNEFKLTMVYCKLNSYLKKTLFLLVITQGMIISIMPFIVGNYFMKYNSAVFSLIVLSLVPMLRFVPNILGMLIVAERKFNMLIYIGSASFLFALILYYITIRLFPNINSISVAVLFSSIFYYVLFTVVTIRKDKMKFYTGHIKYMLPFISYLLILALFHLCMNSNILIMAFSFGISVIFLMYGVWYIFGIKRIEDIYKPRQKSNNCLD